MRQRTKHGARFVITFLLIGMAGRLVVSFGISAKLAARTTTRSTRQEAIFAMSTSSSPTTQDTTTLQTPRVAIIGAGAGGLVAAKAFAQYHPIVLEQASHLGGVWHYDHTNDSPNEGTTTTKDHPMYRNLRTNLPKELMAFREYPFEDEQQRDNGEDKIRARSTSSCSFVSHQRVLQYLQDYCYTFQLHPFIQYNTRVEQLTVLTETKSRLNPNWPCIQLQYTTTSCGAADDDDTAATTTTTTTKTEIFDAVCICNGHYSRPYIPTNLEGFHQFQGMILHSIEYDSPNDTRFENRRVLCVGARASGSDIARELVSSNASHIYLSDSTYESNQPWTQYGVTLLPRLRKIIGPHTVVLSAATTSSTATHESNHDQHQSPIRIDVDVILFCTGYEYCFPFINNASRMELQIVQNGRFVKPLMEQLWHVQYPNIAFVGLPHSIVPFPLMELQVQACEYQWIKHMHRRNNKIDDDDGRTKKRAAIRDLTQKRRQEDDSTTHYLGDAQWDYCRTMAQYANMIDDPVLDAYLMTNQAIWDHSGKQRKTKAASFPGSPDLYRETIYQRYSQLDRSPSFQVLYSLIPDGSDEEQQTDVEQAKPGDDDEVAVSLISEAQ